MKQKIQNCQINISFIDWPKCDTLHTCTKHHTLLVKKFYVAFTGFCKNEGLKSCAEYQDNNAFVCNFGQEKKFEVYLDSLLDL